jgi:hypothetical protein
MNKIVLTLEGARWRRSVAASSTTVVARQNCVVRAARTNQMGSGRGCGRVTGVVRCTSKRRRRRHREEQVQREAQAGLGEARSCRSEESWCRRERLVMMEMVEMAGR